MEGYFPKGILQEFVDSIYFLSGNQIGTGVAFPRVNQVIIINLGTNFTSAAVYSKAPPVHEVTTTVWMNGKQDIPFMLGNNGTTAMYAIGIRLGMMPFFANLPASATNDQAVDACDWTSKEIFNLREQLLACASVQDGFILIENYLVRMLKGNDFSNLDKIKWISQAIRTTSVNQITHTLGCTRKQLSKEAQYYFGSPVKNVQGILRFNQILSGIAHHTDQTLSSLHDYYDQSHFINDFKAHSGITPLQYKRLCRQFPFIKYTPNFIALPRETFLQFIAE